MDDPPTTAAPRGLSAPGLFFGLLVLMDLIFILGDLIGNIVGIVPSRDLRLATDRGHPEYYQYTKLVWAGALTLLAARTMRSGRVLAWAPVILYLLADDAVGLHERFGGALARTLVLPSTLGLRPEDLGELLVTGAVVGVLAAVIVLAWIGAGQAVRALFQDLILATALIGFFGVALDMVHVWFENRAWLLFSLVEDGGEMIAVSLLTAIIFRAATTGRSVDILHRSARGASTPQAQP